MTTPEQLAELVDENASRCRIQGHDRGRYRWDDRGLRIVKRILDMTMELPWYGYAIIGAMLGIGLSIVVIWYVTRSIRFGPFK